MAEKWSEREREESFLQYLELSIDLLSFCFRARKKKLRKIKRKRKRNGTKKKNPKQNKKFKKKLRKSERKKKGRQNEGKK